jgi:hypothetical protein
VTIVLSFILASARGGFADLVVTGESAAIVSSPLLTLTVPIEFYLDAIGADQGNATAVGNFQIDVLLQGPSVGTGNDVRILAIESATLHAQSFPLTTTEVRSAGAEGFGATFNFAAPFSIADGGGLMKVQLEIRQNATPGVYTLNILTGTDQTQLTDPGDFATLLPISTANGSLTINAVPEPGSFMLLGFVLGSTYLGHTCWRTLRPKRSVS